MEKQLFLVEIDIQEDTTDEYIPRWRLVRAVDEKEVLVILGKAFSKWYTYEIHPIME